MQGRGWMALMLSAMLAHGAIAQTHTQAPSTCKRLVLSGELNYGQMYDQKIGNGLRLMLEPLPSGWILRVLPATGPRGQHDYAELATPPYRSMTPLLISTDYSFRAQDVVGWNPRRFHYAANAAQFHQLSDLYDRYIAKPTPQLESELAVTTNGLPEGEFEILDAKLIAGQADQSGLANSVVSHFTTTPHSLVQYDGKESAALGRLLWMRYRIRLNLADGPAPPAGSMVEHYPCVSSQNQPAHLAGHPTKK